MNGRPGGAGLFAPETLALFNAEDLALLAAENRAALLFHCIRGFSDVR